MVRQANILILNKRMATPRYTMTQLELEEEWRLIQAAQANPQRFAVLYSKYYEPILRFIYQRCVDEDLSADLSAQTFVKAYQKINTYSYRGVPFSAWLYTIAMNEVNQHFRKANKNRVVALEDKFVDTIKYEFDNKEELEINIEKLSRVIQLLKADEITIIELRFFEERPFKEVADILGLTETNAKVKVYRIVQKMKELFNGLNRE